MIITLLSDFGLGDILPGIAKGILYKELPDLKIVDISHDIMPHHLLQCCYCLKSSYSYFPEQTIHISLVNLFEKGISKPLLAKVDNQFIISADNGLLPMAFGKDLEIVYEINIQAKNFVDWFEKIAKFLKEWQLSAYRLENLAPAKADESIVPFDPYVEEEAISCQIIHVDRYGNIVLNLQKAFFETQRKGRKFSIHFSRHNVIAHLSQHYSEVPEGEALCLFNAGGFMEVAVNHGSAARLFGLSLTRTEYLLYNKIKIVFA